MLRYSQAIRVILPIVAIFMSADLSAQSAHSRLKDPALLRRFDSLSHKLMCTCGCAMPLRNCNHTGHCNAWPARDALDKLLLSGMSDASIVDGFKNGFGANAESIDAFAMAKTDEYAYMMTQFKNGFGSQILSMPESGYLGTFSLLAAVAALGFVLLFIRSRRKPEGDAALELLNDERREEILRRIASTHK